MIRHNYSYVIINVSDITDAMIHDSLNTAISFRMSLDSSKGVLKFATMYPTVMAGYEKYDLDEILDLLDGPEWTEEEI